MKSKQIKKELRIKRKLKYQELDTAFLISVPEQKYVIGGGGGTGSTGQGTAGYAPITKASTSMLTHGKFGRLPVTGG